MVSLVAHLFQMRTPRMEIATFVLVNDAFASEVAPSAGPSDLLCNILAEAHPRQIWGVAAGEPPLGNGLDCREGPLTQWTSVQSPPPRDE
jgi:hypothetical protein